MMRRLTDEELTCLHHRYAWPSKYEWVGIGWKLDKAARRLVRLGLLKPWNTSYEITEKGRHEFHQYQGGNKHTTGEMR